MVSSKPGTSGWYFNIAWSPAEKGSVTAIQRMLFPALAPLAVPPVQIYASICSQGNPNERSKHYTKNGAPAQAAVMVGPAHSSRKDVSMHTRSPISSSSLGVMHLVHLVSLEAHSE